MSEHSCYKPKDFYHYVVSPIDSWVGLHALSAIHNREGGFAYVSDDFIGEVDSICRQLQNGLGVLRHPPYLSFKLTFSEQQPCIDCICFKENENGVTHLFSRTLMDLEDAEFIGSWGG
jgi:hypothetical protein